MNTGADTEGTELAGQEGWVRRKKGSGRSTILYMSDVREVQAHTQGGTDSGACKGDQYQCTVIDRCIGTLTSPLVRVGNDRPGGREEGGRKESERGQGTVVEDEQEVNRVGKEGDGEEGRRRGGGKGRGGSEGGGDVERAREGEAAGVAQQCTRLTAPISMSSARKTNVGERGKKGGIEEEEGMVQGRDGGALGLVVARAESAQGVLSITPFVDGAVAMPYQEACVKEDEVA
ncbi:hypothetical protein DFH08DRAFT_804327 [Mycena albidolilacea]|uniref:Uncharacterized protein n=1 Tax=Mycena albidolilacea TaxID=1033008 RepID=A0AAD7EVM1_9AGAR|nr:hypothetical protein DFH08DRAFT_804327 [Mycena albidolilacea]